MAASKDTSTVGVVAQAREAFARQAWGNAFRQLTAADKESPLDPDDVERLAVCAYMMGRDQDCHALWERAHHERLARGDVEGAARCAYWLSFGLLLRGDFAQGNGWLGRTQR